MKRRHLLTPFAILVIGLAGTTCMRPAGVQAPEPTPVTLPACQEDEVLVGEGEFESGRWSAYVCGPAVDDFVEGGIGTAIIGFPDGTVITLP